MSGAARASASASGEAPGPGRRAAVETDRDPGLQPERTRLAWRRTTLSWSVAAVLAVRQSLRGAGGTAPVAAISLTAFAFLAFLLLAHFRIQRLAAAQPPLLSQRAAVAVAASTVALAAGGAALMLF